MCDFAIECYTFDLGCTIIVISSIVYTRIMCDVTWMISKIIVHEFERDALIPLNLGTEVEAGLKTHTPHTTTCVRFSMYIIYTCIQWHPA